MGSVEARKNRTSTLPIPQAFQRAAQSHGVEGRVSSGDHRPVKITALNT